MNPTDRPSYGDVERWRDAVAMDTGGYSVPLNEALLRVCELAAKWGYEQATNFKPDWANYQQGKEDGKAEALEQVTDEEPVGFDKGMTIRQWYAGLALQGMLSNSTLLTTEISQIAKETFAMADAMIAEGSKQ